MTLRPEYSLGHSAYNAFLHAPLGRDAQGTELTVLSALTRLGLDPWAEAARLADLARGDAARSLAAAIARLPVAGLTGSWTESEAAAVAERLVGALPEGSAPAVPEMRGAGTAQRTEATPGPDRFAPPPLRSRPLSHPSPPRPRAGAASWLLWGAIAVAFYFLVVLTTPDSRLEPPGSSTTAPG